MSEVVGAFEPTDGSSSAVASSASGSLLAILEQRIEGLVERFRGARKTIEELQSALEEREVQISELAGNAREMDKLKADLRKRVTGLIAQVNELERMQAEEVAE